MGDMGETFKAYRQHWKDKRSENLARSTDILRRSGLRFEEKNAGIHLIVHAGELTADFWPSTGLYAVRGRPKRRGIFRLLKEMGLPDEAISSLRNGTKDANNSV